MAVFFHFSSGKVVPSWVQCFGSIAFGVGGLSHVVRILIGSLTLYASRSDVVHDV